MIDSQKKSNNLFYFIIYFVLPLNGPCGWILFIGWPWVIIKSGMPEIWCCIDCNTQEDFYMFFYMVQNLSTGLSWFDFS